MSGARERSDMLDEADRATCAFVRKTTSLFSFVLLGGCCFAAAARRVGGAIGGFMLLLRRLTLHFEAIDRAVVELQVRKVSC